MEAFKVGQTFLSAQIRPAEDRQVRSTVVPPAPAPFTMTRRRLPHLKQDGSIYWITFCLADAIPYGRLQAWTLERDVWLRLHPEPWSPTDWQEYDRRFGARIEAWLDAGMGCRALAKPDVRDAVRKCMLRFDGDRLLMHAAVIMPTHVHLLMEPLKGHDLSKLLQGIKGASAREANRLMGSAGTFWFDESYDHIVRTEKQYQRLVRYIADNPIKAGLKKDEYWLYLGDSGVPV